MVEVLAIQGFKSVISANLTAVLLQNDADVYQIYSGSKWVSAKQAYATAFSIELSSVTNAQAMGYITSTADLQNIRFYYKDQKNVSDKSTGLPDQLSDTRHYAIKAEGTSIIQAAANYAVGAAVGFWTTGGSSMSLNSCTANFGVQALRSEGFAGIGTAGGSIVPDQGFTVLGIRRPMNVTKGQLADPLFHANFYVDQNVATTTTTTITFTNPIDTEALLPYSLKAGTAIWVRNINTGVESSAILAATPLSGDNKPRASGIRCFGKA